MMRIVIFSVVLLSSLCGGCKPWDAWGNAPEPEKAGFVRDSAKVVSVDHELGMAVLEYQGKQVSAYWQTEVAYAQGGIISQPDATGLKLPVGQYRTPVMKQRAFEAKAGDTIEFVGMWTNHQIFLQTISVKK